MLHYEVQFLAHVVVGVLDIVLQHVLMYVVTIPHHHHPHHFHPHHHHFHHHHLDLLVWMALWVYLDQWDLTDLKDH